MTRKTYPATAAPTLPMAVAVMLSRGWARKWSAMSTLRTASGVPASAVVLAAVSAVGLTWGPGVLGSGFCTMTAGGGFRNVPRI